MMATLVVERSCNQTLSFADKEVLVLVEKGSATSRKAEDSPTMRRQETPFAPTPNPPNCLRTQHKPCAG